MQDLTYTKLINQTLNLYFQEEYQRAYNFITDNAPLVKGNLAQYYNFRYAIACKVGKIELALTLFREAVMEHGFWYSYQYLMGDEDLKDLHVYPEFETLVHICKEREEIAKKRSQSDMKIIMSKNGVMLKDKPATLVMALHGDQQNSDMTAPYWSSLVLDSRLLALPQSSQIEFSDAYSWSDLEQGTRELSIQYQSLTKKYPIDQTCTILGGFSAGARQALHVVLHDKIPVKGLLFVAPWLPEIEEWSGLLDKLLEKKIRCYVICGDQDDDCYKTTLTFVKLLDHKEIPHVFIEMIGLNHDYPENFEQELMNALDYLTSE